MSVKISGTTIILTRGDTLKTKINIYDSNGEDYIPVLGDKIRFALKQSYSDEEPILIKNIPYETCMLHLLPEDTKTLEFGKYVYDIQITLNDGTVDTFISKAILKLTEEVY